MMVLLRERKVHIISSWLAESLRLLIVGNKIGTCKSLPKPGYSSCSVPKSPLQAWQLGLGRLESRLWLRQLQLGSSRVRMSQVHGGAMDWATLLSPRQDRGLEIRDGYNTGLWSSNSWDNILQMDLKRISGPHSQRSKPRYTYSLYDQELQFQTNRS